MSNFFETKRLYLDDTYLYEIEALLVNVIETPNSKYGSHKLLLNQTIFHPQGGGQPSDSGIILLNSETIFSVSFVSVDSNGNIDHHGKFVENFTVIQLLNSIPTQVLLKLDQSQRILHARLHSAGHAIDSAITRVGYDASILKPTKGYHFLDGPYVEFEILGMSQITEDTIKLLPSQLQESLQMIVTEDIATNVQLVDREIASTLCNCDATNYPPTVRIVNIANANCPCGGTHVKSTSELGQITVTKIKRKKNVLRVSYVIS